jgi:drug/metabolite transporter (DMT)-like permease
MFELYGGSFMWIIMALISKNTSITQFAEVPNLDLSWKVWVPMLLFNGIVGFGGYAMRFSAIPLVSTLIFSVLSFTGIVSAFIFGYLFQGEKPSFLAMLGSIFIIVASGVLVYKKPA